jgi:hypothetical protein
MENSTEILIKAAKEFVNKKYELDDHLKSLLTADNKTKFKQVLKGITVPHKIDGFSYNPSINPMDFIERILPFIHTSKPQDLGAQLLDQDLIVGGSGKKHIKAEDPEETMRWLNSLADTLHREKASYYKIGELPIYIAQEGKNRVFLYRSTGEKIRAWVRHVKYPEPKKLYLQKTKFFNIYELTCRDPDFLEKTSETAARQILPFPEISVPLLKAYGAQEVGVINVPIVRLFKLWRIRRKVTRSLDSTLVQRDDLFN